MPSLSSPPEQEMQAGELEEVRRAVVQWGYDLGAYTDSFIERRLSARMRHTKAATVRDYCALLHSQPEERRLLLDSLSINVTNFFRDEVFSDSVVQPLVAAMTRAVAGRPLVAWSAGCASGQEAYTLAIVLDTFLSRAGWKRGFTVWATDISAAALKIAAEGRYPKDTLNAVPPHYRRYFEADGPEVRVVDAIRPSIKFQRHDLREPPPLPTADLIVCRNVMIYLTIEAKAEILRRFNRCATPGGYLILGSAEIILDPQLFHAVDVKHKIYQRPVGRSDDRA